MFLKAEDEDTICALSTPPGTGGIAVIRVSGRQSVANSSKLCSFLPTEPESHKIYYGICRSFDRDEELDEVLVSHFAEGRSFTGEQTIEVSCHGSPTIAASILKELIKAGCRMAKPGEFTYRAFMNGRLDLVQAESVLGLIESQSRQSAKVSLRQLQGRLSNEFHRIEDDLVWMLAHLEASIDFSTEDLEVVSSEVLVSRSEKLLSFIDELVGSYERGRFLKEGIQVAIIGRPNAGKSSLLNAILKEERAIVTAHAGTTRDTVEGRVSIAGIPVTFVDTAGIRDTDNEVEKIGIQRSLQAIKDSDLVLYLVDGSDSDWSSALREFHSYTKSGESSSWHLVLTKGDLVSVSQRESIDLELGKLGNIAAEWISVKVGSGLDLIQSRVEMLAPQLNSETSNVVTQARHLELLQKIQSCLSSALRLMKDNSSPEFIAFELQDAVRAIHELLGKRFDEQVIDRIFKEFCLGK